MGEEKRAEEEEKGERGRRDVQETLSKREEERREEGRRE